MKNKLLLCSVLFFLFAEQKSFAQTPLMNRLCHTWTLNAMDDGTGKKTVDKAQGEFWLVLKSDMTCKQGLQPEGLIASSWKLDEPNMSLTITDAATQKSYVMKILKINTDELQLQQTPTDGGLLIYYTNHDN